MVNALFTLLLGGLVRASAYQGGPRTLTLGEPMHPAPFLSGRSTVERAETLMRDHGTGAATAALARAIAARANDNAVMYCQWREVERLCSLGTDARGAAQLH